jgi:hypothetical protein
MQFKQGFTHAARSFGCLAENRLTPKLILHNFTVQKKLLIQVSNLSLRQAVSFGDSPVFCRGIFLAANDPAQAYEWGNTLVQILNEN